MAEAEDRGCSACMPRRISSWRICIRQTGCLRESELQELQELHSFHHCECTSTRHTGVHAVRSIVYATSSSCSSGVDDERCDDGEFALDTAEVAEEAAVERKEVRQVRPLLSELQVPEWQELAKDRVKWNKME
jgi:hypothetical protein